MIPFSAPQIVFIVALCAMVAFVVALLTRKVPTT